MSKDKDRLPGNKKEEEGDRLTKVLVLLVPLLTLILQALELLLKWLGKIK